MPIRAIFMFIPGMPTVANRNSYAGLKLVNDTTYTVLDAMVDKV